MYKKKSETSILKETLEKGMLRKEVPFSLLTRCSFMTFEQLIYSVRIKGYKILHVYIYALTYFRLAEFNPRKLVLAYARHKSYSRTVATVKKHTLRLLQKKCALHVTTRNVAYHVPQKRANISLRNLCVFQGIDCG